MLTIHSQLKSYHVHFNEDTQNILDRHDTLYLIDKNILLYLKYEHHSVIPVVASERHKEYRYIKRLYKQLLKKRITRNHTLVAIGGGTIQDITGFIASTLMRGLDWDFVPTTLLAMADSCIGGKTSINLGKWKNQIGTFNPPNNIYIDYSYLSSLSKTQLISGKGEIIKIALLTDNLNILNLSITDQIEHSLGLKRTFIELDEFDRRERRLLNFGHTFGHAIETATNFRVPHGIAVMEGIKYSLRLSKALGYLDDIDYSRMYKVVDKYPYCVPYIKPKKLMNALKYDKKRERSNSVNCILTEGPGSMFEASVPYTDLWKHLF